MIKFKRLSVPLLLAIILAANISSIVLASETESKVCMNKEDILNSYYEQIESINTQNNSEQNRYSELFKIQKRTVEILNKAGFEAYDVNPETFSEVESVLHTDLRKIDLNPQKLYILIIEGEGLSSKSSAGTSFSYTYNGATYRLRYLTVTAADDSKMGKTSTVNVLNSKTRTVIMNCLDAAISFGISSVSTPLGVVADICGLSISDFNTAQTSTMYLNGGTNWTRIYTQVLDASNNSWTFGAGVEYVKIKSYMSGMYYDASQNEYCPVPANAVSKTKYSSKYSNSTWRKEHGIQGYLHSYIDYNTVGDVKYEFNGVTKITHHEGF